MCFQGAGVDGEPSSFGCSPPPYCSPPNRASNPIVHDVQFCNQQVVSPIIFSSADTKTISGSSFSSASSSPPVRIEGFDCSMREKTRCEIRCDVRAYAWMINWSIDLLMCFFNHICIYQVYSLLAHISRIYIYVYIYMDVL